MEEKNLWESKLSKNYYFFSSVEDLFKFLEENELNLQFVTKEDYLPGNPCDDQLDNIALRDNIHITYTDSIHPIAISNNPLFNSIINPTFFEEHKEEFIAYAKKKFEESREKKSYIVIPQYIFTNELLTEILSDERLRYATIIIHDNSNEFTLTKEQIKAIKDKHLEFKVSHKSKEDEIISTKYLFSFYTIKDLKDTKRITLTIPIDEETVDNFIYINEDAIIEILNNSKKDEMLYFENLINIIKKLATQNRKYNIKINIENRELLRQSNLLSIITNNINLTIEDEHEIYEYDIETYKKEEDKLDKLVKPIRDSNLSPLEKFIAIYNIAKQFKPYKENKQKPDEARLLRYVLDENNEYIVCVGFANILRELMNRVGIANMDLSVGVDVSYDDGYTMESKLLEINWHKRNLVRIDDDKYDIHGYYVTDSTWDNNMDSDIYLNALMTFNRKKEARRLETLTDNDLLLDFKDINDFKEKINYLFKKIFNNHIYNQQYETSEMSKIKKIKEKYQQLINSTNDTKQKTSYYKMMNDEINAIYKEVYVEAYKKIYRNMLEILYCIDKEKYEYFYNKYYSKFNNFFLTLEQIEPLINEATADYADFVIPLSNNEIKFETIIKAASVVKKEIDGYTDEEITTWHQEAIANNEDEAKWRFPYRYNPNNPTEAYLDTADIEKKHQTR